MVTEVRKRLSLDRGGALGKDTWELSQVTKMFHILFLVVRAGVFSSTESNE